MSMGAYEGAQQCQWFTAPTSLFGATTGAQKCQPVAAPRERSTVDRSNACRRAPFPTSFIWSQFSSAEMLWDQRSKGRVTLLAQNAI